MDNRRNDSQPWLEPYSEPSSNSRYPPVRQQARDACQPVRGPTGPPEPFFQGKPADSSDQVSIAPKVTVGAPLGSRSSEAVPNRTSAWGGGANSSRNLGGLVSRSEDKGTSNREAQAGAYGSAGRPMPSCCITERTSLPSSPAHTDYSGAGAELVQSKAKGTRPGLFADAQRQAPVFTPSASSSSNGRDPNAIDASSRSVWSQSGTEPAAHIEPTVEQCLRSACRIQAEQFGSSDDLAAWQVFCRAAGLVATISGKSSAESGQVLGELAQRCDELAEGIDLRGYCMLQVVDSIGEPVEGRLDGLLGILDSYAHLDSEYVSFAVCAHSQPSAAANGASDSLAALAQQLAQLQSKFVGINYALPVCRAKVEQQQKLAGIMLAFEALLKEAAELNELTRPELAQSFMSLELDAKTLATVGEYSARLANNSKCQAILDAADSVKALVGQASCVESWIRNYWQDLGCAVYERLIPGFRGVTEQLITKALPDLFRSAWDEASSKRNSSVLRYLEDTWSQKVLKPVGLTLVRPAANTEPDSRLCIVDKTVVAREGNRVGCVAEVMQPGLTWSVPGQPVNNSQALILAPARVSIYT